jgi:hypothetical protein
MRGPASARAQEAHLGKRTWFGGADGKIGRQVFDVLMRRLVCIEWENVHVRPSVSLVGKQDIQSAFHLGRAGYAAGKCKNLGWGFHRVFMPQVNWGSMDYKLKHHG